MSAVPAVPRGSVVAPCLQPERGEIARWRHGPGLPALELRFFRARADSEQGLPAAPARVTVAAPLGPLEGVTDPAELRQMAWCLLAGATWLQRQQEPSSAVEKPAQPQLTIYDHLQEATP